MKKVFLLLTFMLSFLQMKADEGMWLMMLVKRLNGVDLQKKGLHLTPEEIYSVNNSSLKDGIVQFGGGCTAEVVSKEGLVLPITTVVMMLLLLFLLQKKLFERRFLRHEQQRRTSCKRSFGKIFGKNGRCNC
jgi:hypothetical protein